jgi:hypothetical protein
MERRGVRGVVKRSESAFQTRTSRTEEHRNTTQDLHLGDPNEFDVKLEQSISLSSGRILDISKAHTHGD